MRNRIIMVLVAALILVPAWVYFQKQQEKEVRTQIVADYLAMTQVMSSFMMEVSISKTITPPSRYSQQVTIQQNKIFQKKYQTYKNLRLFQHNRLEDLLDSVDRTVANYLRLAQSREQPRSAGWLKQEQIVQKLFFYNAVYSMMAVAQDRKSFKISHPQRRYLLNLLYGTYGGIFLQYEHFQKKPPFIADIMMIRDCLIGPNLRQRASPAAPSKTSKGK